MGRRVETPEDPLRPDQEWERRWRERLRRMGVPADPVIASLLKAHERRSHV